MSTLEQLTGQTKVPEVSTAIGTEQSFRPAKAIAGESLAQDLIGIIKPLAATVQEHNTASVKAAQRSAMDRKAELSKYIANEESQITPDTDLRALQERIQGAFLTLSNTTFENEDAQNSFDAMYTRDAGVAVSQKNARFESIALEQDASANFTNNIDGIAQQTLANIPMSTEQINVHIDSMTAGGYYNKEQAYEAIAYGMNTGLNENYKINKNLPIYNNDGSVNTEKQMDTFNVTYGSAAIMDEAGAVRPVGGTTEKAMNDIINNWRSLKVAHTAKTDTHNREYERMIASGRRTLGNTQKTYTSSQEIVDGMNLLYTRRGEINTEMPLTETQDTGFIKLVDAMKNEYEESKIIETDVLNGDIDDIRTYLEDGKKVDNFYDVGLGTEKPRTIVADKYRSIVNKLQETASNELLQTNISPENQAQFNDGMELLNRWEQISGSKSAFTKKYEDVFKSGSLSTLVNRQELEQAVAFRGQKALVNAAYEQNAAVSSRLEMLLAKRGLDGEFLNDVQLATEANNILTIDKNTNQAKINSTALDQLVTTELENVAVGEGAFTRIFDAELAQGSTQAIKNYIITNGKELNAKSVVQDMQYLDYGTVAPAWFFGGSLDQRVLIPVGVEERVFERAIDNTIAAHNKKFHTDYDAGDVAFRSVYDKGVNNFVTEIYNKDDVRELIGVIDAGNVHIVSTKGE